MVETIQRYSNQLLPPWAHRGAATAPPAPAGAVGGEGQAGFPAPKDWTTKSGRHAPRIPAPNALPAAPEAASGPPLTLAQRRLLVAAGAGIPARLLSSRPSQQAQALAQQPLRGAWRTGATYRPALRAAATAALTAAATSGIPRRGTSAGLSDAASDASWQRLRDKWREVVVTVQQRAVSLKEPDRQADLGLPSAEHVKAAFQSMIDAADAFEPNAEVARLLQSSGCSEAPAPSAFLHELSQEEAVGTGVGDALSTQLSRVVMLLASQAVVMCGVSVPAGGSWAPKPSARLKARNATTALAQALLEHHGCPQMTYSELRLFAMLLSRMQVAFSHTPAHIVAGITSPSCGPLTSVPALALLARATHAALLGATPNAALTLTIPYEWEFADQVVTAYMSAVLMCLVEGPQDRSSHKQRRSPDWLAEAVRKAADALEYGRRAGSNDPAVAAVRDRRGAAADAQVLLRQFPLQQQLLRRGSDETFVSGKDWLALEHAQVAAAQVRIEALSDALRAWLPQNMADIARAVCSGGSGDGGGGRGPGRGREGLGAPGEGAESGAPVLDSAKLWAPATRSTLSRALLATHVAGRRTRLTVPDAGAFSLLAAAAGTLCSASAAVRGRLAPFLPPPSPAATHGRTGLSSVSSVGCGIGLLLRPPPNPGPTTGPHRRTGAQAQAQAQAVPPGALDVELVPLPSPLIEAAGTELSVQDYALKLPGIREEALQLVRESLASCGAATLWPQPPTDVGALEATLLVAQRALLELREAGREALLVPVLQAPTAPMEAAADHVLTTIAEGGVTDGGEADTSLAAGLRDKAEAGAFEVRGLQPGWPVLWRGAAAFALSRMLRDGCHPFADDTGLMRAAATTARDDPTNRSPALGALAGAAGLGTGLGVDMVEMAAEWHIFRNLREAVDAELDVRQVRLSYTLLEVRPGDPSRPLAKGLAGGWGG
ncbi:hypothetical protein HYH03_009706 [Edaphochlamys debaryana]|uniref:Uncharacterized protein n=1 Tax=Edaphochlamys debaryana TaxID=47281 RepID=A0A835Y3Q6_9CHLO|nr:hypothetical protein HYH03_009706 [Edaphochlamys debaryana]|eukprot:KAG2491975.1 hypothetical protein HYH03_009706 [Edaphochlamys debaryana]